MTDETAAAPKRSARAKAKPAAAPQGRQLLVMQTSSVSDRAGAQVARGRVAGASTGFAKELVAAGRARPALDTDLEDLATAVAELD
jgi:hypothetical protein